MRLFSICVTYCYKTFYMMRKSYIPYVAHIIAVKSQNVQQIRYIKLKIMSFFLALEAHQVR